MLIFQRKAIRVFPRGWLRCSSLPLAFGLAMAWAFALRIAAPHSAGHWELRWADLLAYNYLVFGLFGIMNWLITSGLSGVIVFVFMGELLGFAAGWVWSRRQ